MSAWTKITQHSFNYDLQTSEPSPCFFKCVKKKAEMAKMFLLLSLI